MKWRVMKPCEDCPFNKSGPGLHLRKSLNRDRWAAILAALRIDQHFLCHKTTRQTGNGTNLVCAGSIEWQEKHGYGLSQYARICMRLGGTWPKSVTFTRGSSRVQQTRKSAGKKRERASHQEWGSG